MLTTCDLAAGELQRAPLALLLIEALRTKASGELEIGVPGGTSRLYFRDGHPCGVQVFFGFKPLGQFLLELGWIDLHGLERSLMAVADGRKQGEALVSLGLLTPDQLEEGLRRLHRGHLETLAALETGTYRFVPTLRLPSWTESIRLRAHRAIVDSMRSAPGRAVAHRILREGLPDGEPLRLRRGWERFALHFELSAEESAFLAQLEMPRMVAEVGRGELEEVQATALMAALLLMGVAVPHREGERSPGPAADLLQSASAQAGGSASPAAPQRPITEPGAADRPSSPGQPGGAIQGADPSDQRRGPGDQMGAPGQRTATRPLPPPGGVAARYGGPQPAGPAEAHPSRAGASKAPAVDPELERRRREEEAAIRAMVEERWPALESKDLFALLGVKHTAADQTIKKAFLQTVKVLHPDRLPAALSELRPRVEQLFSAVTEANEVLSDPAKRSRYLREQKEEKEAGGEIRSANARQLVRKGEELLRQRRFSQALAFFMQALQIEDHPAIRAHAVWAANADPRRPAPERARAELERLGKRHPGCEQISHYLNQLDLRGTKGVS